MENKHVFKYTFSSSLYFRSSRTGVLARRVYNTVDTYFVSVMVLVVVPVSRPCLAGRLIAPEYHRSLRVTSLRPGTSGVSAGACVRCEYVHCTNRRDFISYQTLLPLHVTNEIQVLICIFTIIRSS